MIRKIFVLLFTSLLFWGLYPIHASAIVLPNGDEPVKPVLKFKNGRFKIVQFTDLHWSNNKGNEKVNDSTFVLMRQIIQREHPDLVVITGDVVIFNNANGGWNMVTKPMIESKTPFAITLGNHDPETDMTREQILKKVQSMPYNVTYNADDKIEGIGNCTLPIMSSDGNQYKWVLYLFDSHNYPKYSTFGYYDWIKFNQIEWYRKQSDLYTSKAGKTLPSLAFFHIPLPEYNTALWVVPGIGNKQEGVCSPNLNSGLFASFLEKRDVLGVFAGHDHNNDYLVDFKGEISLAYGRKTGYNPAYTEPLERGARVINLFEDERSYNTYITTLKDKKEFNYTFEQKPYSYPVAEGTFIQKSLVLKWDDARWQEELQYLKDVGMKYLVFAPSMGVGKTGKVQYLYPSIKSKKGERPAKDLIDMCLRNAKKAGLKVFIGLNFDEGWWTTDKSDTTWIYQQMRKGNDIAAELVSRYKQKYDDTMYGWYWVWEADNLQITTAEKQKVMARAMNINLDYLNKLTPDMPVMLSPYWNSKMGSADDNAKSWTAIFRDVHFKCGDIFAPQDGIGAGGTELNKLSEWFDKIRQAVNTKPGLKLWANVESFDQLSWTSAPLSRFINQMDIVYPYVNKIITFAYPHYYSPGQVGKQYHETYLKYCLSGSLPDMSVPAAVTDFKIAKKEKTVVLQWKSPVDKTNLAGYHIYKDGVLIANVQKGIEKTTIEYEDKIVFKDNTYEISTYNVLGKESMKIKAQN